MPFHYPPATPTLSGDAVTTNRFLKNPTLVARALRDISAERFISDVLLTGRMTAVGGAVLYEQGGETIYADGVPKAVAPGAEYPLTTLTSGAMSTAKVEKWGLDTMVTDESITRQNFDPVRRALLKMSNSMVKQVDSVAMSAINTAITQTVQADAVWDTGSPNILRDILKTVASVRSLNDGIDPDTLVVDDMTWAYLASDPTIAALRARETGQNPIDTGNFFSIAGIRVLPSPNLGLTKSALLVDTDLLGGMADENLEGPGYVSADGVGVQAKVMRDDDNDQYRLRCRRVTVPVILEPRAGYKITGVLT